MAGPYYIEFENTGDDVVLMKAGTDEFLKITSNQLILDDGTTQLQAACAAGEHKAGIAFAESRGDELVTNGGFDTDSDWGKSGNWTISGGVASSDGSSSYHLTQPNVVEIGKTYEISFEIVSYTSGSGFRVAAGSAGTGTNYTTLGEHSEILTCSGDELLYITAAGSAVGSVDNISVKEVTNLMNLNLDDSWETQAAYDGTLGSGVLTFGETMRNVKRWNETDYTKQKDKIDFEMV